MRIVLRFLGRALFVVLLFTLAFEKLQHPELHRDNFSQAYGKLHSNVAHFGLPLPSQSAFDSRLALIIKFTGLLEALMASFILIGDGKGAFLATLYFLIVGAYMYLPFNLTKLMDPSFFSREKLANGVALVGISMVLMCA